MVLNSIKNKLERLEMAKYKDKDNIFSWFDKPF